VVAAAVILDRARIPKGLNDTKQLDEETREELFPRIMEMAIAVGVGEASVGEIDLVNIRQATHLAMARAVRALAVTAEFALVDGNDAPALPCKCDTLVKGDGRSVSIAAASIIAKVTRDRLMASVGRAFPDYGFEHHMGYSTPAHFDALGRHGPCEHHRRSFAPIRAALGLGAVTGDLFGEAAFARDGDDSAMPTQVVLTDQPAPTVIPAKAGTQ